MELYCYRARYYHPTLQRFISEDPIGVGGGAVNLYAYVLNDPVNLVDPSGRFSIEGVIPAICIENPVACTGVIVTGYVICRLMGRCQLPPPEYHSEGNGGDPKGPGKRRKNRIPDRGEPNTVCPNPPGTTKKKYGPDGWVQKEWNKGHGPDAPREEQDDHIHDYTPNPYYPEGRPTRGEGRPPRPGEL